MPDPTPTNKPFSFRDVYNTVKKVATKQTQIDTATKYKPISYDRTNIASLTGAILGTTDQYHSYTSSKPGAFVYDNDTGVVQYIDPLGKISIDPIATKLYVAMGDARFSYDTFKDLLKGQQSGASAGLSYLDSEQIRAKEAARAYEDYISRITDLSALRALRSKANTQITTAAQNAIESKLAQEQASKLGVTVPQIGFAGADWNHQYDQNISSLEATIPKTPPSFYGINLDAYAPGVGATSGNSQNQSLGDYSIPVGPPVQSNPTTVQQPTPIGPSTPTVDTPKPPYFTTYHNTLPIPSNITPPSSPYIKKSKNLSDIITQGPIP